MKKAVRDAEIAATALAKVPDAEVQLNALQVVLEAAQTQSTELGAKLERLGAQSKKLLKQYGMTGRGDSLDVLCQTMNEFRQQWLATELQLEQQVVAAEKKRKKAAKKEKQRAKAVAGGGTPRNSEDCEKRVRKSRKHKAGPPTGSKGTLPTQPVLNAREGAASMAGMMAEMAAKQGAA